MSSEILADTTAKDAVNEKKHQTGANPSSNATKENKHMIKKENHKQNGRKEHIKKATKTEEEEFEDEDDDEDVPEEGQSGTSQLQKLITAKISELEDNSHSTSALAALRDKEARKFAKVNKRQIKEWKEFLEEILSDPHSSIDDKIKLLSSKYLQLLRENKLLERELNGKLRKCEQLSKEKESLNVEVTKNSIVKSRLESLCHALREDSKKIQEQEHSKRQELSKKFHEKIQEISVKMEDHANERIKLCKENEMLRDKLKSFASQYEIREKHFETQLKAKNLEIQLLEAKLKHQSQVLAQESLKAKKQAEVHEEQIKSLTKTERELRAQLSLYAEQFQQFQETISKNNEVFRSLNSFKQDMDRMSETIKRNERENFELKKKCEQTDIALIDLAEERNRYKKQLETVTNQKKKLEELCRALQSERKNHLQQQQSKSNNNTPPSNTTTNNNTNGNTTTNTTSTPPASSTPSSNTPHAPDKPTES